MDVHRRALAGCIAAVAAALTWPALAVPASVAGRLVPLVQRFALAQAAAAHTAIQTRATVGKTVLVP
jgi:NADPH2:quinone reductase